MKNDEVMTEEKQTPVKAVKPVYDPRKAYRWNNNDVFYFSGEEFGITLNAMKAIISTEAAQTILLAERAARILEQGLARSVEQNIAKEEIVPKKPTEAPNVSST